MYRGNETAETARWLSEHKQPCIIVFYGKSLSPVIKSAQPVVVEPISDSVVVGKDDIVFCRVHKSYRLQKVIGIRKNGRRYTVGDNHGHINGTINRKYILGIAVNIL
ncbi:MAG: hypothetical protein K1W17_00030 [Oscillospiraceae bacterium]